ncbi:MAG: xanthine dehydrogenase family protein subunit M [Actinomycetota bacterium]|nr:xanthine dehydrogenase family protein subunit M [Actinomycetota bacterium]
MIPSAFEYEVAENPQHAIELLNNFGDEAKLLAGGHSLLPLMKLRFAAPTALVDIGRIRDLSYVRDGGDHISIGAGTVYEDVHNNDALMQHCPIVAHTAGEVGDPQVRHRGTIGGSVAHGDPASDLPTVLLALDATMVVQGSEGERTIPAGDFFKGIFETALSPQDLLTEIRVPKVADRGWSYQKFHHRAQDWATVGVAAVVQRSNGGVGDARIALTSMGETPLRAGAVEQALAGGADPAEASQLADEGTNPVSDPLGSSEYRKEMAKVFTRRALEEALSR